MSRKALFEGLVLDESGRPVSVVSVGDEAMYVVDDAGFRRHIPAEQVDRQVLDVIRQAITGHEDLLIDQTAKMLGQDDPFSKAAIAQQYANIDRQFEAMLNIGIPEDMRAYLGMMGFKITIDLHGEVLNVDQPGLIDGGDDE
ncbi:MAG: hypothetical protein ACKOC5_15180 [Chloroflexota bacterium]